MQAPEILGVSAVVVALTFSGGTTQAIHEVIHPQPMFDEATNQIVEATNQIVKATSSVPPATQGLSQPTQRVVQATHGVPEATHGVIQATDGAAPVIGDGHPQYQRSEAWRLPPTYDDSQTMQQLGGGFYHLGTGLIAVLRNNFICEEIDKVDEAVTADLDTAKAVWRCMKAPVSGTLAERAHHILNEPLLKPSTALRDAINGGDEVVIARALRREILNNDFLWTALLFTAGNLTWTEVYDDASTKAAAAALRAHGYEEYIDRAVAQLRTRRYDSKLVADPVEFDEALSYFKRKHGTWIKRWIITSSPPGGLSDDIRTGFLQESSEYMAKIGDFIGLSILCRQKSGRRSSGPQTDGGQSLTSRLASLPAASAGPTDQLVSLKEAAQASGVRCISLDEGPARSTSKGAARQVGSPWPSKGLPSQPGSSPFQRTAFTKAQGVPQTGAAVVLDGYAFSKVVHEDLLAVEKQDPMGTRRRPLLELEPLPARLTDQAHTAALDNLVGRMKRQGGLRDRWCNDLKTLMTNGKEDRARVLMYLREVQAYGKCKAEEACHDFNRRWRQQCYRKTKSDVSASRQRFQWWLQESAKCARRVAATSHSLLDLAKFDCMKELRIPSNCDGIIFAKDCLKEAQHRDALAKILNESKGWEIRGGPWEIWGEQESYLPGVDGREAQRLCRSLAGNLMWSELDHIPCPKWSTT